MILNVAKVGVLTALALSIIACGSSGSSSSTLNPVPLIKDKADAQVDKAKDAIDKAKAEAEAKLKAETERARTEPLAYNYKTLVDGGNISDFEPLIKKDGADILKERISGEKNGVVMPVGASSYTVYSSHVSDVASIALAKLENSPSLLYVYAGRATNANELSILTGVANYTGKAYVGGSDMTSTIQADFTNKTISGSLKDTTGFEMVKLNPTQIIQLDGAVGFKGENKALYEPVPGNAVTGSYEGTFMGRGATAVAGKVTFDVGGGDMVNGVFIGKK